MKYTKLNEISWNIQSSKKEMWTVPVTHEEYMLAVNGKLELYLTPVKPVPLDWFPELNGAKVLGLASGGGQQGPIFIAHGANTSIMDLSDKQLETECMVANREGYEINIVKADMTEKFPFEDETFDLVFHPISNCYIQEIKHVWNECFRILKKGGILLSGFCKEELFMFEFDWKKEVPIIVKHQLPFNPLLDLNDSEIKQRMESGQGIAFSHTLEEQIGGQINAGFTITGIYDDRDRDGVFARYMNSYAATRAVKP